MILTKQVDQKGDDDGEENQVMISETLTRRKQATLEEKKKIQKLEKEKIVQKKKILIPSIHWDDESYRKMIQQNQEKLQKIPKDRAPYIRHFIFWDRYPQEELYNLEEDDVEFIGTLIGQQLMSQEQQIIIQNPYVQQFIKLIESYEDKNDRLQREIKQNLFDDEQKLKIHEYWQQKCLKYKRPLLRKNWKVILEDEKYGTYNSLYKAFHERKKQTNTRKSTQISSEQKYEILLGVFKENEMALCLQELVTLREQLNLLNIKAQLKYSQNFQNKLEHLHREIQKKQLHIDNYFPKVVEQLLPKPSLEKPIIVKEKPVIVEPIIQKPKTEVPKDLQYLIASTVSLLNDYGFRLDDIECDQLEKLNEQIHQVQNKYLVSKKGTWEERTIQFRPSQILKENQDQVQYQSEILIRRQFYQTPLQFVQLVKQDSLKDPQSEFFHWRLMTQDQFSDAQVYLNQKNAKGKGMSLLRRSKSYLCLLESDQQQKEPLFLDNIFAKISQNNFLNQSCLYNNISQASKGQDFGTDDIQSWFMEFQKQKGVPVK